MSKPDDDTNVPSGFNDDAEMERTLPRVRETNNPCGLTCDNIGCKGLYGFDIDGDSVLAGVGR